MIDLITASILEGNDAHLQQVPRELLDQTEQDLLQYVFTFQGRYDALPTLPDLQKKFSWFAPFVWSGQRPPLLKIYDDCIERKLMIYTRRLLTEVSAEMSDSGTVNLGKIGEIQRLHALSDGIDSYTTFDRRQYFRRSRFDFPLQQINSAMGGIANGDYALVIGRLGTGKSMLTQYCAKSFFEQGMRVLYASGEMPGVDVFSRIDGMVGHFSPRDFREGRTKVVDDNINKVQKIITSMKGAGEIFVPRRRIVTPTQVMSTAMNLKVDLVFIDGVYLMQPSAGQMRDRYQNLAAISNELKQMALETDIPIIGTAQIKRGADRDVQGNYTTEAVAGTDDFGRDVDFLVAIDPDPIMQSLIQVQLIKNRYGPNITSLMEIDYDTMTITDQPQMVIQVSSQQFLQGSNGTVPEGGD